MNEIGTAIKRNPTKAPPWHLNSLWVYSYKHCLDDWTYMLGELASTAKSEMLPLAIDWARARIADKKKRKRVGKLIEATALRAGMIPTGTNLAAKFRDTHLIEELLAHHQLEDITKDETIAKFVGDGADDAAINLVSEFYDEVTRIVATGEESLSDRKTQENTEQILSSLKTMQDKMAELNGDTVAQVALLEEMVGIIENSPVEVNHLRELGQAAGASLASSYLGAYVALCCGGPVDYSVAQQITGNDTLVKPLCSIAISARRPDDISECFNLLSFDCSSLSFAVRRMIEAPRHAREPVEVMVPEGKDIDGLIGLVNFENIYGMNGYQAAADYAKANTVTWNPVAREQLAISELIAQAMLNDDGIKDKTLDYIESYRDWFSDDLTRQYEKGISIALTRFREDDASELLAHVDGKLGAFVEDEQKNLRLRSCRDSKDALLIVTWAEAKHNPMLLIAAALKAIDIDERTRAELIPVFRRSKRWAFPNGEVLKSYVDRVEPFISYEDYLELGEHLHDEPVYHLTAYNKFRETNPEEANHQMELALEQMKATAPELPHSSIWIPYLVENGRKDEILALVKRVLPLAPLDFLRPFLSAVAQNDDSGDLLDRVIEKVLQADFKDPSAAEAIAGYLVQQKELELAGRLALKAFHNKPSESLAEIATQWLLESSLPEDEAIVAFAENLDTPRMNVLMAYVMKRRGSTQQSNSYLIRAAFGDERVSGRALLLYATWNLGKGDEDKPEPTAIGPDTSVVLTKPDGETITYIFLADGNSVKMNGASGPAGNSFNLSSDAFIRLRGHRVGEAVRVGDTPVTVTKIEYAGSTFSRAGFAELSNAPDTVVIKGTPEEAMAQIKAIADTDGTSMKLYKDGIQTDSGSLYLGIETGSRTYPARQLEFTIAAITDPNMPYRRAQPSNNYASGNEDAFLLSYSATVALSLHNIPEEVRDAIKRKCSITDSTAERLRQDAKGMVDEAYASSGRLSFQGDRPVFIKFDDSVRGDARDKAVAVNEQVGSLGTLKPVLENPNPDLIQMLSDNAAIDIETSKEKGYVLVTEDALEAQIIDAFGITRRCSLTWMLLCLGQAEYLFSTFAEDMASWGAEPVLEGDIVAVLMECLHNVT